MPILSREEVVFLTPELLQLLLLWLAVANVTAFAVMGIDKRRAKRGDWRISEKGLFLPAVLGGSIGAILGMRHFRHKTKHWYFKWGLPALLVVQLAAAIGAVLLLL